jgi:hypothetical protein
MISLALALALLAQDAADAATPAPPAVAEAAEDRLPAGAPKDDYRFVAWCYGTLRGYLDLHDEVMPEVTRIESEFRRPGSNLKDDLKVYADMQKDGRAKLKLFQEALTAAEKASLRPINTIGAEAVRQGRETWNAGAGVTPARKAQEWMSWALPARCERVAGELATRAKLMGATFRVNEPEDSADAAEPAAAEAPPAGSAGDPPTNDASPSDSSGDPPTS